MVFHHLFFSKMDLGTAKKYSAEFWWPLLASEAAAWAAWEFRKAKILPSGYD